MSLTPGTIIDKFIRNTIKGQQYFLIIRVSNKTIEYKVTKSTFKEKQINQSFHIFT